MRVSRIVLFLGMCWLVECDLLDLYVQHMDETMRTRMYEKKHVKNLARTRNARSAPVSGQVGEVGEVSRKFASVKKVITVEEGWKGDEEEDEVVKKVGGWEKRKIEKNDGLEFENDREENWDPSHYENLGQEASERLEEIGKDEASSPSVVKYKGKSVKKVLLERDDGLEAVNDAEDPESRGNDDSEVIEAMESTGEGIGSNARRELNVEVFESAENEAGEVKSAGTGKSDFEDRELVDEDYEKEWETEAGEGDLKLDVEMVNDPEDLWVEKSGFGPSLKRHPKPVVDRAPKKYSPTAKEIAVRQKVGGQKLILPSGGSSSLFDSSRTKRSAEKVNFLRSEELDVDGDVLLEWDPTDEDEVTFRVTAKTLGYVGIGFNDQSHMKGADILLGWIDDDTGNVNLLDSHGIEERNTAPVTDGSQDVSILDGIQNDTHTIITFSRKWHTCDPQDRQLTGDTVHVLWALHETDPQLNNAAGHGERRGGRALRLKAPAPHPPPANRTADIRQWDIKLNQFAVSDDVDTVYWCKIFRAPQLKKKHHMIGYTPLIERANEALVHHIILYECAAPIPGGHAKLSGAACYSGTMPKAWESCLQPVLAWARGSKGEWFPNHVGIPVAEHGEDTYYMLEVHYNNPGLKKVVDSSGVRLHLTPNLRPHEAGILVAGVAVSPLHMVPPKQKEYATAGYCTPHCTNTTFPADGINIVSVVLHSHLAGKRLGLKHIRQGKELPRIAQDNHFDFNYQQSHTLEKEVKVLPGDELVTECVYGTLDRANLTLGGYAATQEMCLAFMVHYPRTQLAACYSMTPVEALFRTLGVGSFKDVSFDDLEVLFLTSGMETVTLPATIPQQPAPYPVARLNDERDLFARLVIDKPDEFQGRTLTEHMLALPWTDELLARSIERNLYHGRHMTYCRRRDDKLALPTTIQMFPNFTELPEANETTCSFLNEASSSTEFKAAPILIGVITVISQWRLLVRF